MTVPPPSVYRCSADWRFLLPVQNLQRALLIEGDDCDCRRILLDLGLPLQTVASWDDLPADEAFDWIAAPQGIAPSRFASLSTLRGILRPGGSILLGARGAAKRRSLTRALRASGYGAARQFAASPNENAPEYIFSPSPRSFAFFLSHRYAHKLLFPLSAFAARGRLPLAEALWLFWPVAFVTAGESGGSFLSNLSQAVRGEISRAGASFPLMRWMLHANGQADWNDNVIFFGFEDGKSFPSLAAKVPRWPGNNRIVRNEYARLSEMWRLLGGEAARRVPEPIALVDVDGHAALILSYAAGHGLTHSVQEGLWRDPLHRQAIVREAGRLLGELHRRACRPLEETAAPFLFPRMANLFRSLFSLAEEEERLLARLEQACQISSAQMTLLQGDFWHGNLLRSAAHGGLMLVDWQYARWDSDVSLDVYLFLMAGALACAQGETIAARARRALDLLLQWQAEVLPVYLAAYDRPQGLTLLPPREGMARCCVEKVTRTILDFDALQDDASLWRALFAELARLPEQTPFNGLHP